MIHDYRHTVDGRCHVTIEAYEIVFPFSILEKHLKFGIVLVHVVHYAEINVVVFFRLGGDFRRIPVKIEPVSRIVDDSGAVFLRKNAFAHDPVTVCGARLQTCHGYLVESSDRFPAESAEIIILGPFAIVEIGAVVRSYFEPADCRTSCGPHCCKAVFCNILEIWASVDLDLSLCD